MHTIKPLDTKAIEETTAKTGAVLTIEEHQKQTGLGSSISYFLMEQGINVPFISLGVDDQFGESGSREELLKKHHLDIDSIIKQVEQLMLKKAVK